MPRSPNVASRLAVSWALPRSTTRVMGARVWWRYRPPPSRNDEGAAVVLQCNVAAVNEEGAHVCPFGDV